MIEAGSKKFAAAIGLVIAIATATAEPSRKSGAAQLHRVAIVSLWGDAIDASHHGFTAFGSKHEKLNWPDLSLHEMSERIAKSYIQGFGDHQIVDIEYDRHAIRKRYLKSTNSIMTDLFGSKFLGIEDDVIGLAELHKLTTVVLVLPGGVTGLCAKCYGSGEEGSGFVRAGGSELYAYASLSAYKVDIREQKIVGPRQAVVYVDTHIEYWPRWSEIGSPDFLIDRVGYAMAIGIPKALASLGYIDGKGEAKSARRLP